MDDDLDAARDLPAKRIVRHALVGLQGETLELAQRIQWPVGMDRSDCLGTGIGRRDEVGGFRAAYLSDHEEVRTRTQREPDQVADGDPGLLVGEEAETVRDQWDDLVCVLDHHHTLSLWCESYQHVDECGLSPGRRPGDENARSPPD